MEYLWSIQNLLCYKMDTDQWEFTSESVLSYIVRIKIQILKFVVRREPRDFYTLLTSMTLQKYSILIYLHKQLQLTSLKNLQWFLIWDIKNLNYRVVHSNVRCYWINTAMIIYTVNCKTFTDINSAIVVSE